MGRGRKLPLPIGRLHALFSSEGQDVKTQERALSLKTARRKLARGSIAFACVLAMFIGIHVPYAFGSSELQVEDTGFNGTADSVSTQPNTDMWDIAISTNGKLRNKAGKNDTLAKENVDKVILQRADGSSVEGWSASIGTGEDDAGTIYIDFQKRLAPLAEYRIVLKSGIRSAGGASFSSDETISFKTDAECDNGLTVYQNVLIVVAAACIAVGIVVEARRVRKRLR